MEYIFFILSTLFFASCNSDSNEQVIVDRVIHISVKDSDGNDLLNPNFSNSLNQDEFKIFHEINGEQVEFYEKDLSNPKGFIVYEHENEYRISVTATIGTNDPYTTMYIKWSEMDTDTLKCEIDRKGSSEICKKVWFNNELVWKAYATERFFEITK